MRKTGYKTKILLCGNHLASVSKELVYLLRRTHSITNYVAWVKEQAHRDFGLYLETKEDIDMLQGRVEAHGFASVGEWLECLMREQLGLWSTTNHAERTVTEVLTND